MLLPVILLVSTIPTISGQQCSTSSDCSSPDAPYCSKWGWCQWTSQFGSAGPGEVARTGSGLPLGSCRSSGDCTPRAPVCSSQGFCTWEPAYQEADNSRGNKISQTGTIQGSKGQTINRPRNNQQAQQTGGTLAGRASRTHQQFLKSQSNHLDLAEERISITNNFKRSSGRGNSKHRKNNEIKQKQSKRILQPFPAVPDQTTKSSRNLPHSFEPHVAVPVPGIQRRVPSTTTTTRPVPPSDYIDRVSTDSDYYDYYDYNYYAEFEVMKQQVSPEAGAFINREALYSDYQSNDQRDSENQRKEPHHHQEHHDQHQHQDHHDQHHHQDHHDQHHHQAVHASVSQGCLADCVTDCVSIEQLTAYRDCVEFCGKTCNDKK